jgi:Carboxypeptidase regulatory-like domain/TonB dependent receptor
MIDRALILRLLRRSFLLLSLLVFHPAVMAQSTAMLQGTIVDQLGAVVPDAKIVLRNRATRVERTTQTDSAGRYQIAALPVGSYRVEVQAPGWQTQVAKNVTLEVSQTTIRNFQLTVGSISQEITVTDGPPAIESATITVGQVVNQRTVQELPLNGRHFVELGLLISGSVVSPQDTTNLVTRPTRGQGAFGFHTAGNRAETVNFMINGINLNDMATNIITFQPSIATVQEFKVDNSTFSAEYGRNSGAIVNIATRSGNNQVHGETFEFLRNETFDARNFFDQTKPPFKRNQFGVAVGGPIHKNRTFFFATYEGLRQRQELTMNSGVLSDAERAQVTDLAVRKLLNLIPRANAFVAGGPRFIGPASAPSDLDQWTGDVGHELTTRDHLHAYYAIQQDSRGEPTDGSATIPNFGDVFQIRHQVFTLNESRIFGPNFVNEMRMGFNRVNATIRHKTEVNPADFGINNGITEPIGLPQITVGGIGLSFGGPITVPQGRADTTVVFSDTVNYLRGPHSSKFGGEIRRFEGNIFMIHPGLFGFANPADFIRGNANSFSIVQGKRSSSIDATALGLFVQDSFKWRTNVTLELGLRYELSATPTERFNRFVVFDPLTVSLVRVGSGIDRIYHTNHKLQPRVGFSWDPFKTGRTSVRGAYAVLYDQPTTLMVGGPTTNPPLATPLSITGAVRFDNALSVASATAIAPASVARDFDDAYVQSWNLNVQREIKPGLGAMIGYFGSKGTHLLIFRNINQITKGLRPFPKLSATSPILPGSSLGNITEADSAGISSYNALWAAVNKRLTRGLQFNASYTWSKSLDYNSLSRQGVVVQDSLKIRDDRGLSDFDARHRFVINWLYELPWRGSQLIEGWQISGISQLQSGNPINILAGNPLAIAGTPIGGATIATFTGLATLRPDVIGSIRTVGSPTQWFTNIVCDPRDPSGCPASAVFALPVKLQGGASVFHFGNLGRNVVIGPGFSNTDLSVLKDTKVSESLRLQFRAEIFDIFNHATFGQPGPIAQVGSSSLGVISNTRFPTGDSGSSRQIQFAVKLIF